MRLSLGPAVIVAALAVAACGGSNNKSGTAPGAKTGGTSQTSTANGYANVAIDQGQQKGGTLHVVSAEGWEHLDPGDDIHASADYRAQLVRVLTARVVGAAREMARMKEAP